MATPERPTLKQIYDRMYADTIARVTNNVRIPLISFLNIIIIVFSGAIHLVYGYLQAVLAQSLAESAVGAFLIRLAAQFRIIIKAASFAEGDVIFTGTNGTTVVSGTQVVNADGITYSTTEEFIIGTTVSAALLADEAGNESNFDGTFVSLVNPLPNVDDAVAVVDGSINGGFEQETEEELRLRLLQRLQNPPASGSKADYVRWALSIAGIQRVWVKSGAEYLGGGSVAIIVADENLDPVGSTTVGKAQDYIDTVKPIGARFADVIDNTPVTTTYTIQINPYNAGNEAGIIASLQTLHLSEATPGGTLYLTQIQAAIAETPLINYVISDITLGATSGAARDLTTEDFDVAKFTSATITQLS